MVVNGVWSDSGKVEEGFVETSKSGPSRGRLEDTAPHRDRPRRIGRFVVLERIGAGGMGTVFAAFDAQLDRRVAIKVVNRPATVDQDRLVREAQALAALSHPNVVPVFELGEHEGAWYVAMEYVDGTTLDRYLDERGDVSWREIVRLFTEAGQGLDAVHAAGLIHRDFKPENVMVGRDGRVRVMDFGLARGIDPEMVHRETPVRVDLNGLAEKFQTHLTAHGNVMGTPLYMAPEQYTARGIDARVDVFAFCVAFYEALLGQPPYRAKNVQALFRKIESGERCPLPEAAARIPAWLLTLVERGLDPDPKLRWPNMGSLLAALRTGPGRSRIRLAGRVSVATAAAAVLTVGTLAFGDGDEEACVAPYAHLVEQTFTPEREAAIGEAFRGFGPRFVESSARATGKSLRRHAQQLLETKRVSCTAQLGDARVSDPAFDAQSACLETARLTLDRVATELERGDAEAAERFDRLLGELVVPSSCLATAPTRVAEVSGPPGNSGGEVTRELLSARVRHAAGRADGGWKTFADLRAQAREDGSPFDEALVVIAELETLAPTLSPDERVARSMNALEIATLSGDRGLEARALLSMIETDTTGDPRLETQRRRHWATLAKTKIAQLQTPPNLQFTLLRRFAALEEDAADYAAALRFAQESVRLAQSLATGPDVRLARAQAHLAHAHMMRGEFGEAVRHGQEARAQWAALVGPKHPVLAAIDQDLAATANAHGDYDAAIVLFGRAQRALVDAYGPDAPEVGQLLPGLARAYDRSGRPRRAHTLLAEYLQDGHAPRRGPGNQRAQARRHLCDIEWRLGEASGVVPCDRSD